MAEQSPEEIHHRVPRAGDVLAQLPQAVQQALDGVLFLQIITPGAQPGQRDGPFEHAQRMSQAFRQLFAVLAKAQRPVNGKIPGAGPLHQRVREGKPQRKHQKHHHQQGDHPQPPPEGIRRENKQRRQRSQRRRPDQQCDETIQQHAHIKQKYVLVFLHQAAILPCLGSRFQKPKRLRGDRDTKSHIIYYKASSGGLQARRMRRIFLRRFVHFFCPGRKRKFIANVCLILFGSLYTDFTMWYNRDTIRNLEKVPWKNKGGTSIP